MISVYRGKPVIILDPGHGRRPGSPGYDPGVKGPHISEAQANWEMSLTLKAELERRGWHVRLTHTASEDGKGSLYDRMRGVANLEAELLVSIHYNMIGSYGLIYYAAERKARMSYAIARQIDSTMGYLRVWKSTDSRFKRLYIDDYVRLSGRPAIMWEVDAIDRAPLPGLLGREHRLALASKFADSISFLKDGGAL